MIRTRWAAFGFAIVLAGCGGSGPGRGPATPHGGVLVGMPEDKGFVEVVKREKSGSMTSAQALFYFLDSSKNPVGSPPKSATLKLRSARKAKPIELKPVADGALEASTLPDEGDIEGELITNIDGKSVTVPINVR